MIGVRTQSQSDIASFPQGPKSIVAYSPKKTQQEHNAGDHKRNFYQIARSRKRTIVRALLAWKPSDDFTGLAPASLPRERLGWQETLAPPPPLPRSLLYLAVAGGAAGSPSGPKDGDDEAPLLVPCGILRGRRDLKRAELAGANGSQWRRGRGDPGPGSVAGALVFGGMGNR